jgi:integrase
VARRRKRGSGGIFQRANGRWTGQITIASSGGRIRKSYTSKNKGDVEFWLREAARAVRAGDDPVDTRRTLADHLDDWLTEVGHTVRPITVYGYRVHVDRWIVPVIGDVQLVDLQVAHVRKVRDGVIRAGKSPRWAQAVMTTLRMALRQAVRDGLLSRNVAEGVRPPRQVKRRVVATSTADAWAILDAFEGHRLESLVIVAIGTGLRLGELLGLRWSDVAGGTIRITGSVRRAPLEVGATHTLQRTADTKTHRSTRALEPPAFVIEALEEERRRQMAAGLASPYVFVSRGRRDRADEAVLLDPKNTTAAFQRQLKAAGLPPMRFHDLRHAFATMMLGLGVPLRVIQEWLGHTSMVTTAGIYAHVLPALERDAAGRLDSAIRGRKTG